MASYNKKTGANFHSGFAPPQGLEPWTCGLTVRRSNRLSYGGFLKASANLFF